TSDGSTPTTPVATFPRARTLVRTRLAAIAAGNAPATPIEVRIAPGEYPIRTPLELTSEDGGTSEETRVTWSGSTDRSGPESDQSRPVLTGGLRIREFRPVTEAITDPTMKSRLAGSMTDRILVADLTAQPVADKGELDGPNRLAVYTPDGTPLTLARYPNSGFVGITGLVGGSPIDVRGTKGDASGNFRCEELEPERLERWRNEPDAWLHGYWFWDWSDQRQRIASIDPQKQEIRLVPPYHGYGYRIGQWFYGMNMLCELDAPGEWYYDRDAGWLFLYPPEEMTEPEVWLAVAPALMNVTDASYLTIRNLTFATTRGQAITVRTQPDCTGVVFDGCTFRAIGDNAITVHGGTRHEVRNCEMYHLGAGGVQISGGDRTTLTRCDHLVDNCHIHHYGEWRRMYSAAVTLGGVGVTVSHGTFHDAPHCAILYDGNDHTLEYNEIFRVIQEAQDAGAIYTGRDWTARGTVIRYNYLHDFEGYRGTWGMGIYLDDMHSGTTIHGNIFRNVHWAAFIGGGRDNVVSGNIFVRCPGALQIDNRAMGWASEAVHGVMTERLKAVPYEDEPWRSRWPQLMTLLQDEPAAPKGNLIIGNVFVGGDWDHIQDGARPYITLKDNRIVEAPDEVAAFEQSGFVHPERDDW
ncbi:MAG: right-handed parallel beta-helix repeat-containing protein, partial [Planctomycetia bacterium]|nr:right-handed parallel beta-helix repeat-containing protein [Planctomycetia bacterium]